MATLAASSSPQVFIPSRPTTVSSSHIFNGNRALPINPSLLSHSPGFSLRLRSPKPYLPVIKASASANTPTATTTTTPAPNPTSFFSDSIRTISSLLGASLALSKLLAAAIESVWSKVRLVSLPSLPSPPTPTSEELDQIRALKESLVCSAGTLFFAAISNSSIRPEKTPLGLLAGAMVKWLDIYGGILMIRVLLSWFPNIPWHRQPLSAVRDLSDPFLSLFRNIIPPLFNMLDISPIFAFTCLGLMSKFLRSSGGYLY